jgi:ATP-dependent Lon protease
VPLRSTAVYPLGVIGVQIGIPTTLELLAAHPGARLTVAVVVAPGGPDEPVDPRKLEKVAVRARVSDRLNMPGGTVQLTLQGIDRVQVSDVRETDGYFVGQVEPVVRGTRTRSVAQELIARILNALEILSSEVDRVPREVPRILRMNLADPGRFRRSRRDARELQSAGQGRDRAARQRAGASRVCAGELERQLARVRQIATDEEQAHPQDEPEPEKPQHECRQSALPSCASASR